jgi:predicted transcriptional regulator
MVTTTIRLDEELKARVAAAAERSGKTPHAFMLEAIAESVEQDEVDAEFHRIADERWAEIQATGETVAWEDMKAWLEARVRGENPERPKPRKFPR